MKTNKERRIDPRRGIIISYQRSGLNWVRYCIEELTGMRTPGRTKLIDDGPVGVYRTHNVRKNKGPNSTACIFYSEIDKRPLHNRVLLLLRDYRESFIRVVKGQGKAGITAEQIRAGKLGNFPNYFCNLRAYDAFKGPKMLVWYDELVTKFEPIPRILDFFDLRYDISDFDVEEHRKCSLSIYDDQHRSFTKNNPKDLTYHQRTVESAVLEAIDEYVQNHHADLLDKYGLLRHDNLTQT